MYGAGIVTKHQAKSFARIALPTLQYNAVWQVWLVDEEARTLKKVLSKVLLSAHS